MPWSTGRAWARASRWAGDSSALRALDALVERRERRLLQGLRERAAERALLELQETLTQLRVVHVALGNAQAGDAVLDHLPEDLGELRSRVAHRRLELFARGLVRRRERRVALGEPRAELLDAVPRRRHPRLALERDPVGEKGAHGLARVDARIRVPLELPFRDARGQPTDETPAPHRRQRLLPARAEVGRTVDRVRGWRRHREGFRG